MRKAEETGGVRLGWQMKEAGKADERSWEVGKVRRCDKIRTE